MSNPLVPLFAKRFVQRRDVKAVQMPSGAYVPDRELKNLGSHAPQGFKVEHLEAHLDGSATYGHYLLDSDDQARVFALDIDLEKSVYNADGSLDHHTGAWCKLPPFEGIDPNISDEDYRALVAATACDARATWFDRSQVEARSWFKYQMGMLARNFATVITKELQLPCAAAYSGSKGVHVYGFTGPLPAKEVREAALLVLDIMDEWDPKRGNNFFQHRVSDPMIGYPSFSVEIYPKQDSLGGKDLGNLMRLPMGRNLKSPDPCFFLDLTTPAGVMAPHPDPVRLLETGDCWA